MTDQILAFLFSPWGWLSAAVAMAIAEILLPGAFMIWLAAAAFVTALLLVLLPVAPDGQLLLFAALSAAALVASRHWKKKRPILTDDPALNRRTDRFTGQTALVTEAIAGGRGRVRLGDGEWIAEGPDAPVGARVRISGADGAVLKVETPDLSLPRS